MAGIDRIISSMNVDDALCALGLVRRSKASGVGSLLLGLGIGALGGAAAALLLAPMNGPETRDKLMRAGEDLGKSVTTKISELTQAAKPALPSMLTSSTNTNTNTTTGSAGGTGSGYHPSPRVGTL